MARKRKYTPKVVREVRRLHAEGVTRSTIAARLGCHPTTVSRLLHWGASDPRSARLRRRYVPKCIVIDVESGILRLYAKNGAEFKFHPFNRHIEKFIAFVLNKAMKQEKGK